MTCLWIFPQPVNNLECGLRKENSESEIRNLKSEISLSKCRQDGLSGKKVRPFFSLPADIAKIYLTSTLPSPSEGRVRVRGKGHRE